MMLRVVTVLMGISIGAAAWAQSLALINPVVRATPPGQTGTAAYVTLRNDSDETVELVGAKSNRVHHIMLHSMKAVDGMMRMRHVDSLAIAPGETLSLAPGGLHLMLMGLDQELTAGETLPMCLQFSQRQPLCTSWPVRRPGEESN